MGRVKVSIVADKSGFDSALQGVKGSLEGLKEMVAGAFTVEAITALVEKTFEYADTIDKTSLRMKMTTEQTQALGIIAKEAGSSLETIETAFKKIEKARAKALGGNADELKAFKALGLSANDLSKGNNTIGIAAQVASAGAHGSTDKEGVALQNLGLKEASGDLIAIGDGLKDFDARLEELKGVGAIMPDEDIANMVRAKDELDVMGNMLMAQVAPAISGCIDFMEKYYIAFKAWFSNIFAAIGQMATDTMEFIKNLPLALGKSVLGIGGKDVKGVGQLSSQFGRNIANDTKETIGQILPETLAGLTAYEDKKQNMLDRRAAARLNKPEADTTPTAVHTHKQSIYSDTLTSTGNMLGASYASIKSVTQIDLAKQQLAEQKKMNDLQAKVLEAIITAKAINPLAGF
jgi:hypothetical protein